MKPTEQFPRIFAWFGFLCGLGVTLLVDRWMRVRDGQIQDGGLPELIYFGAPLLIGLIALAAIWRTVKRHESRKRSVLETVGHLAAGYVVYTILLLHYVLGSGIDSL